MCKRRRAILGSTALLAFFDCAMENVSVASLGDSEAGSWHRDLDDTVLIPTNNRSLLPDEALHVVRLNEYHNASNPQEAERLGALAKQLQEPQII